MNDKQFHKNDTLWMDKMKSLREKQISDGILKGFSSSVERRITPELRVAPKGSLMKWAWVPVFAVLVMGSILVLRSPIIPTPSLEYAQVVPASDQDLQDEIEVLKELGVWDEYEDLAAVVEEDILDADMEIA